MSKAFNRFKESSIFIIVTTIVPIVAVVATVLMYVNSEALRDQSAQHRLEVLSLETRVEEKNSQVILLNEQIKQKGTQVQILRSQVELLQKVVTYQETLSLVEVKEQKDKLASKHAKVEELRGKLEAYEDIKSKFGKAGEIANTISSLRSELKKINDVNLSLQDRIAVYEPKHPELAKFEIKEGSSETLLNGSITIGLVDAYGTWGYINVSNFGAVILEREEIKPGKNILVNVGGVEYVIIIDVITNSSITSSLLAVTKNF